MGGGCCVPDVTATLVVCKADIWTSSHLRCKVAGALRHRECLRFVGFELTEVPLSAERYNPIKYQTDRYLKLLAGSGILKNQNHQKVFKSSCRRFKKPMPCFLQPIYILQYSSFSWFLSWSWICSHMRGAILGGFVYFKS